MVLPGQLVIVAGIGLLTINRSAKSFPRIKSLSGNLLVIGSAGFALLLILNALEYTKVAAEPRPTIEGDRPLYQAPHLEGPVASSSEFSGDGVCHNADKAIDDQVTTSWVSQAHLGRNQTLSINFQGSVWVSGFVLQNGVAGSLKGNGRVVAMQLIGGYGFVDRVRDIPADSSVPWRYDIPKGKEILTSHLVLRFTDYTPTFESAGVTQLMPLFREVTTKEREHAYRLASKAVAPRFVNPSTTKSTNADCLSRGE